MKHDKKKDDLKYILLLYFAIALLWTGYRLLFSFPEWVDEFIAKPILWLTPLMLLQKIVRTEIKIKVQLFKLQNIIFGFGIGVIYFAAHVFLSRSPFSLNPDGLTMSEIGIQLLIALATGYVEEVIFRRIILEKSLSIFNDSITANSFTTILFTLIHLPIILFIYKYPLVETISYLSILTLSGFIYGLVYLKNKSLAASTTTHAVWNFLGTIIK